jgi:4-carboxymuconolactone decarboxylase
MKLPADVYPESRNRLPMVRRDDLDDDGKKIFDAAANDSRSIVGLQGPGGIRLHNPVLTALSQPLNRYLRFEAGLDRRVAEVAILATARELDQDFEWSAHEAEALKIGVAPDVIDIVRFRRPVDGLGEQYAAMIRLVREAVGRHHVSPETFSEALRLFGRIPLLNYVALIGNYMGTAVLLTVFNQQLPPEKSSQLP